MKVRDLTRKWLQEQRDMYKRARIMARFLDRNMGDVDIDTDVLIGAMVGVYGDMGREKLIATLTTPTDLAIHSLTYGLEIAIPEGLEDEV